MDSYIKEFIDRCAIEDIGNGDHTSMACIDVNASGHANVIAKEDCIIAGISFTKEIFNYFDKKTKIKCHAKDGDLIKKNTIIMTISGGKQLILSLERMVLNCMQRMSGIASNTYLFVKEVRDLNVTILDTRKTCPSIRFMDKEAVKIGGGKNHREGLYDVMMIKDNHIDFCGGITSAIDKCNKYLIHIEKKMKIIIEVRDFNELNTVLKFGKIDRILLDNFSVDDTKKAVKIVDKKYPLESSGNIDIHNVKQYGHCGVNYISIGALTHSVKSCDISLICR